MCACMVRVQMRHAVNIEKTGRKKEGLLCCCSSHPAFGISGWLRLPIIPSTPARAPLKFSTKVTNDEDGMPMRGARLHSYRRPGGAWNKVGRFTRPWSFQPSSPVLKSARNHSHSINESLIHQMPLIHDYSDGHHVFFVCPF